MFHPVEDVAASLISLDPSEIALTVIPTSSFVGTAETQFAPGPGDEVFFPGLLGQVPSMGQRNVPMLRGGIIGALHQSEIPMRLPDDTVLSVHGHLIDCRSFGGFSGSPCFVRFTSGINVTPRMGLKTPQVLLISWGLSAAISICEQASPCLIRRTRCECRLPLALR